MRKNEFELKISTLSIATQVFLIVVAFYLGKTLGHSIFTLATGG